MLGGCCSCCCCCCWTSACRHSCDRGFTVTQSKTPRSLRHSVSALPLLAPVRRRASTGCSGYEAFFSIRKNDRTMKVLVLLPWHCFNLSPGCARIFSLNQTELPDRPHCQYMLHIWAVHSTFTMMSQVSRKQWSGSGKIFPHPPLLPPLLPPHHTTTAPTPQHLGWYATWDVQVCVIQAVGRLYGTHHHGGAGPVITQQLQFWL
jgi:hypothetical protein